MVSRAQRRRGPAGWNPDYSNLPWPSDVTEADKRRWKAEWERENGEETKPADPAGE